MKKIYKNGLFMLVAASLAASCADYNETGNFQADPDPSITSPYSDLGSIKSYIDKTANPFMTIGVSMKASEFNQQELAHTAAVLNFDNVSCGNSLMSGGIITASGAADYLPLTKFVSRMKELDLPIYGSPIAANTNQADAWFDMLTAPIEVEVETKQGKTVSYADSTAFHGYSAKGSGAIAKIDGKNVLRIGKSALNPIDTVSIVEFPDVDLLATYTVHFKIKAAKKTEQGASYTVDFSGNIVEGTGLGGKFVIGDQWTEVKVVSKPSAEATEGYLRIENTRTAMLYVSDVWIEYTPDNHRPQTAQEVKDTMTYALNRWCDGLMKNCNGYVKTFDLIDDAIGTTADPETGILQLKSAKDKYYWQTVFGSENYAPVVSKTAIAAFKKYGGNPDDLKFLIAESGLDNEDKMRSLLYWIGVWEANGAKIDGINAKVNLAYSEDEATQAANVKSFENLLARLVETGKFVRISGFDVKYMDAEGKAVTAKDITTEQRQKLADYNAYLIKYYMNNVPQRQQGGICKSSMVDDTAPVGLWAVDGKSKDWVRSATYKAFCDALSGK